MRIISISPQELFNKYVNVRERMEVPAQRNVSTDKVVLTNDAKTFSASLKAAKEAMASRSPDELKHIDEVAEQIRQNTYSVLGYKVAEKILGK